jgi:hypothetical protein
MIVRGNAELDMKKEVDFTEVLFRPLRHVCRFFFFLGFVFLAFQVQLEANGRRIISSFSGTRETYQITSFVCLRHIFLPLIRGHRTRCLLLLFDGAAGARPLNRTGQVVTD